MMMSKEQIDVYKIYTYEIIEDMSRTTELKGKKRPKYEKIYIHAVNQYVILKDIIK